eukprot:Platyproteum_vivax@DN902_c0_g1_i1.p1
MQLFITFEGASACVSFPNSGGLAVHDILTAAEETFSIPALNQSVIFRGKDITSYGLNWPLPPLEADEHFRLVGKLCGGKGGFGSLLRGQKGSKKKTVNFDACRDLHGRRVRNATAVERLKQWLAKKKHDDSIVNALGGDNMVCALPKAQEIKLDDKYVAEMRKRGNRMMDLVKEGLVAEAQRLVEEKENLNRKKKSLKNSVCMGIGLFDDATLLGLEIESDDDSELVQQSTHQREQAVIAQERENTKRKLLLLEQMNGSTNSVSSTTLLINNFKNKIQKLGSDSDPGVEAVEERCEKPVANGVPKSVPEEADEEDDDLAALEQLQKGNQIAKALEEAKKKEEEQRLGREASDLLLTDYPTAEDLAAKVDAAVLKMRLQQEGLKCGGTALERAKRLVCFRDHPHNPPATLFAKAKKL